MEGERRLRERWTSIRGANQGGGEPMKANFVWQHSKKPNTVYIDLRIVTSK